MTSALPSCLSFNFTFYLKFIAGHQPNIVLFDWKDEKGKTFFRQTPIPPHSHILLRLTLLERLIIISLKLYQRFKNLLVLVWVSIAEQNWLVLLLDLTDSELCKICGRLFFQHLLNTRNLFWFHLARRSVLE